MTVAAAIGSPEVVAGLYCAAGALAALASASELMARFKDEPLKVLLRLSGATYLVLNAALAAVVLLGLRFASEPKTATLALEQVFLAGFGARVIARTKVVGFRGKDGEAEEIGPGAAFEQLLAAVSREADRDRAAERLDAVSSLLEGIPWEWARVAFVAEMAGAMQDLTEAEQTHIKENFGVIAGSADLDDATRLDLLGFLVLNYAGEEFLKRLVTLYKKRLAVLPT